METYSVYCIPRNVVAQGYLTGFLRQVDKIFYENIQVAMELRNTRVELNEIPMIAYSVVPYEALNFRKNYEGQIEEYYLIIINKDLKNTLEQNKIKINGEYIGEADEKHLPKEKVLILRLSLFNPD